mmetsp:Transcript_48274/g.95293  ORF Transcript_48274/g.95293 Transcript_48274/m.95293 type:complete len:240 (+) Transcript_48274:237-956(+)
MYRVHFSQLPSFVQFFLPSFSPRISRRPLFKLFSCCMCIKAGAKVAALSCPSQWAYKREAESGSGSWVASLVCRRECWGALLLQMLRTVPIEELEEATQKTERDHDHDHIFALPLQASIRAGWRAGTTALLERGVSVNRKDVEECAKSSYAFRYHRESPVMAALATDQWDLARDLAQRGGDLTECEREQALDGWYVFGEDSPLPVDLLSLLSLDRESVKRQKEERQRARGEERKQEFEE